MLIIILRYSPSNPSWMRVFIMNKCWILSNAFMCLLRCSCDLFPSFVNDVVYYIDWGNLFLLFIHSFWPRHAACGILVPWAGIEPMPLHWKWGVTTESPGKYWEIFFLRLALQYKLPACFRYMLCCQESHSFFEHCNWGYFFIFSNLFGDTMHRKWNVMSLFELCCYITISPELVWYMRAFFL